MSVYIGTVAGIIYGCLAIVASGGNVLAGLLVGALVYAVIAEVPERIRNARR